MLIGRSLSYMYEGLDGPGGGKGGGGGRGGQKVGRGPANQ